LIVVTKARQNIVENMKGRKKETSQQSKVRNEGSNDWCSRITKGRSYTMGGKEPEQVEVEVEVER
jgi:hypothetical protein